VRIGATTMARRRAKTKKLARITTGNFALELRGSIEGRCFASTASV
jgi:hypothetical protein